ncbi:CRISPR-associated helicase Cas3' [Streptomyces sp. NPDC032472]|uniref:CRISPR-associated helicase Cas3' n=1 Tax=Streptomyces sp. NPDC032472 TaxID=3155018 RepID=UPI0033DF8427
MLTICIQLGLTREEIQRLGTLWGKSAQLADGTMNLLLPHMLDTAAVAERVWDDYLAPSTKQLLDEATDGRGRRFFAWVCGIHDCGKATPAFQSKAATEAAALPSVGLVWDAGLVTTATSREWTHDKAGGHLLRTYLKTSARWSRTHADWIAPLVSGHHGTLRAATMKDAAHANGAAHGTTAEWRTAQAHIVEVFTRAVGYQSLTEAQPVRVPARAVQLALLGFLVMADWIASDATHFPGIPTLDRVCLAGARKRAAAAWADRRLGGGLRALKPGNSPSLFQERFGQSPRASQSLAIEVAGEMAAPGLLFLEAPMGEGKTKTALAVAEILAARFGKSGVFVGMPTQATADPIFSHVRAWAASACPGAEDDTVLLHGKRAFNPEWKAIRAGDWTTADARFRSIQEDDEDCCERYGPAEFFLGPKMGLLAHLTVGTIDQLLYAATRTRHVMLRTAGLSGKVVILDEVHACDVYMSQFLKEALFWLGQLQVPVVLLSATLPPTQRAELADAYMAGAQPDRQLSLPAPDGYPNVTAVWSGMDAPLVAHAPTWRDDLPVQVRVLPEPPTHRAGRPTPDAEREQPVADLLAKQLVDGGCALVIRNTVRRAQRTYRQLAHRFGDDVVILHGQLTTAARADRTQDLLDKLGPDDFVPRPKRVILVATQVAEQSFDIDADVIVTDIAPIDLLLQRVGRAHRHTGTARPERLATPAVYVTAFAPRTDGAGPAFERGAEFIYGRHLLLRTAAAVLRGAATGGWAVPSQVPELVAGVYADAAPLPMTWMPEAEQARAQWDAAQETRRKNASTYLLTRPGEHGAANLDGLHYAATEAADDDQLAAVVRDGEPSIEAILVLRTPTGYTTLNGTRLANDGSPGPEALEALAGDMMRLPARLTAEAVSNLAPLPGWTGHAWLRRTRALVLTPDSSEPKAELVGTVGGVTVTYNDNTGLAYTGER